MTDRDMSNEEEIKEILTKVSSSDYTKEDVLKLYQDWAKRYDKDITTYGYARGPEVVAEKLADLLEGNRDLRILDMGCGTGFVGEELKKRGFINMDALDASSEMLEVARGKGVYNRLICDYMGANKLDVEEASYDALVCAGTFVPNHANDSCFEEMIRICKPGGHIVFTVAAKHINEPEFKGRLEPRILQLEETGAWKWLERKLHEDFLNFYMFMSHAERKDKRGILFVLQKEE